VTITPAGNLTKDPGKNVFEGNGVPDDPIGGSPQLIIGTEDMPLVFVVFTAFDKNLGTGMWRNDIPPGESVPEPATWALFDVGALMLAFYGQRRGIAR
jgi:hypothetical protein